MGFRYGMRATLIPISGTVEYCGVNLFAISWVRGCAIMAIVAREARAVKAGGMTGMPFIIPFV